MIKIDHLQKLNPTKFSRYMVFHLDGTEVSPFLWCMQYIFNGTSMLVFVYSSSQKKLMFCFISTVISVSVRFVSLLFHIVRACVRQSFYIYTNA